MNNAKPKDNCANCQFFSSHGSAELGLCRVLPPVRDREGYGRWPKVRRTDWCGKQEPSRPPEDSQYEELVREAKTDLDHCRKQIKKAREDANFWKEKHYCGAVAALERLSIDMRNVSL